MYQRHFTTSVLTGFLAMLLTAQAVPADEKDDAEALLKNKGLRRVGTYFSLPEETKIGKLIRATTPMKKQIRDAQRQVAMYEKAVQNKQALTIAYLQKRRELRMQLQRASSATAHNRIASMMNELADRIVLMQESDKEEKTLKEALSAVNEKSEAYIEQLFQARQLYDQLKEKYGDLAADPQVGKAVEAYSEAAGKTCKLGPTASFLGNGRRLKKMEDTVLSESIDLRRGGGGLWYVPVTFHGKYTHTMAIDTGASLISLPWKMASSIGLLPNDKSPTLRISLADGRVIEAKEMFAEKVRVGKFTVEKVRCAVMPKEFSKAAPLLGQSFLRKFTYKIDSANSKLVMSKVEADGSGSSSKRPRRK